MRDLIFRASSLAEIMTEPKAKGETLSAGAKTAIKKMAREFVYGFDSVITSKYMTKGIEVEDKSIELLNSVLFTDLKKNTERKTNEWVTGECDIYTPEIIYDIKSSWSLETFPVLAEDGEDKTYEWQARAYMWLWDVNQYKVAYCLVDTPEHLIGYENKAIHQVSHIPPHLRVTFVSYERDKQKEAKIVEKVEASREYYKQIIAQIAKEHGN